VKTVIKPSSPPHPAEVNEHLGLAYQLCNKLIEGAELRGDQAGADAWLVARNAIEAAEKAMREAREKQTWRTVQGERVHSTIAARARADSDPLGRTAERVRVAHSVACPTCGAPIGYPCQFSPAERHEPNERIHVARANLTPLHVPVEPVT